MWELEEQGDLLVLYKNMLLGGLKKDNFKELSKRMSEIGWDQNNDQCRQQVFYFLFTWYILLMCFCSLAYKYYFHLQIYLLQDRFDKMTEAGSKTGGVLFFEPLRVELNDCFGALKNVQPDSVFSSRKGLLVHKPDDGTGDEDSNGAETASDEQAKNKRERKSTFIF